MSEFDNDLLIGHIRSELHDLRIAAEHDELSDAQTTELGNVAEMAVETWKRAIGMMADRWSRHEP